MADFKDRMADYVPVNERLAALLDKYPDASLQSEIVELTDTRVTIKAIAYRTPDDARPGIGHSSMEIPGGTPYTRGSEIENAETSAWGRAIAALGFEVKRGLASAEEVANHSERSRGPARAASSPSGSAPAPRTKGAALSLIADAAKAHGLSFGQIEDKAKELGINRGEASIEDLMRLWGAIEQPSSVPAPAGAAGVAPSASAATTSHAEGSPDSSGSAAATAPDSGVEAVPPVTPPESGLAPSMEDILAATGGTAVPPPLDSDEFKALPPAERATARVYWQTHAEPARPDAETLRMGLEA